MESNIEFTNNYNDLSTDRGFQFEFLCARCGVGLRSKFKPFALGNVSSAINTASNIFGGFLNNIASAGEDVKSAAWEKAHDQAFEEAIIELRDEFIQCPKCSAWVCRKKCWNTGKGLCKDCAPDLGVEMAAAQASKSVEEVWAHAAMAEEDKKLGKEYWREGITATCPNCEKPLAKNVKFCPECGFDLKQKGVCPKCNAKLQPNSKFCPECGNKLS
jgi:membrane protease subunit (stomatin/prohibitin family)